MKKINRLLTSAVIYTFFSFTGCTHHTSQSDIFKSLVLNKEMHLTQDEKSPTSIVNLRIAYAAGEDSIAKRVNKHLVDVLFNFKDLSLMAAADSFVSNYMHKYSQEVLPLYQEDISEGRGAASYLNYTYEVNTVIEEGASGIWNYTIETNAYQGGAHGNHIINCLNFKKEDGSLLTLNELFITDYEVPLNSLLLKALLQETNSQSIEEVKEKGYLQWTDIYPSKEFLVESDGITFIYNAYDIAPYVMGSTTLHLSYSELESILKK